MKTAGWYSQKHHENKDGLQNCHREETEVTRQLKAPGILDGVPEKKQKQQQLEKKIDEIGRKSVVQSTGPRLFAQFDDAGEAGERV